MIFAVKTIREPLRLETMSAVKKFLFKIVFLLCALFAFCEEEERAKTSDVEITHLLSLDFMLLLKELSSGGIGFGVQYEQQVFPHYALKGYFGHATINTKWQNYYCTTVSFALFAEWYPLSNQLRQLYIGAGSYFDYLAYLIDENEAQNMSGEILSVVSQVGYKFSLPHNFLIDVFCSYKYPYKSSVQLLGRAEDYLKSGFQYGIGIKRVLKK